MADGGAGSNDAFRCPDAEEVLTYPFASFVIRYGGGARLSASTAALAGVMAELSPCVEVRDVPTIHNFREERVEKGRAWARFSGECCCSNVSRWL